MFQTERRHRQLVNIYLPHFYILFKYNPSLRHTESQCPCTCAIQARLRGQASQFLPQTGNQGLRPGAGESQVRNLQSAFNMLAHISAHTHTDFVFHLSDLSCAETTCWKMRSTRSCATPGRTCNEVNFTSASSEKRGQ